MNERSGGRNALTAKVGTRNWKNIHQVNQDSPTKAMSFYQEN